MHCNTIVEAVVVIYRVILLTLVVKPLVPFTPLPSSPIPGLSSLVQTPSLVQPIVLGGQ